MGTMFFRNAGQQFLLKGFDATLCLGQFLEAHLGHIEAERFSVDRNAFDEPCIFQAFEQGHHISPANVEPAGKGASGYPRISLYEDQC